MIIHNISWFWLIFHDISWLLSMIYLDLREKQNFAKPKHKLKNIYIMFTKDVAKISFVSLHKINSIISKMWNQHFIAHLYVTYTMVTMRFGFGSAFKQVADLLPFPFVHLSIDWSEQKNLEIELFKMVRSTILEAYTLFSLASQHYIYKKKNIKIF